MTSNINLSEIWISNLHLVGKFGLAFKKFGHWKICIKLRAKKSFWNDDWHKTWANLAPSFNSTSVLIYVNTIDSHSRLHPRHHRFYISFMVLWNRYLEVHEENQHSFSVHSFKSQQVTIVFIMKFSLFDGSQRWSNGGLNVQAFYEYFNFLCRLWSHSPVMLRVLKGTSWEKINCSWISTGII